MPRHPIVPILVFVVASVALEENYPFSEFSMYSNPTGRPLHYHYITDGEGEALPLSFHTRMTPSKLSKSHNKTSDKLAKKSPDRDDASVDEEAGREVLAYLVDQNATLGPKRRLPEKLRLVEVKITEEEGRFVEEETMLATYP